MVKNILKIFFIVSSLLLFLFLPFPYNQNREGLAQEFDLDCITDALFEMEKEIPIGEAISESKKQAESILSNLILLKSSLEEEGRTLWKDDDNDGLFPDSDDNINSLIERPQDCKVENCQDECYLIETIAGYDSAINLCTNAPGSTECEEESSSYCSNKCGDISCEDGDCYWTGSECRCDNYQQVCRVSLPTCWSVFTGEGTSDGNACPLELAEEVGRIGGLDNNIKGYYDNIDNIIKDGGTIEAMFNAKLKVARERLDVCYIPAKDYDEVMRGEKSGLWLQNCLSATMADMNLDEKLELALPSYCNGTICPNLSTTTCPGATTTPPVDCWQTCPEKCPDDPCYQKNWYCCD